MKHYGKLTAAAAAGFMALSAMGVAPVFAEEPVVVTPGNDGNYTITKTLTLTDGVKPADAVTFTYSLTGNGATYDPSAAPDTKFEGPTGGLTVGNATANEGKTAYTSTLTANASAFPGPGIFKYTLVENAVDTTKAYNEGLTDTVETYTVNVSVILVDGVKTIQGISATKTGESVKATELSFAATYDPSALTVIKATSGNQDVAGTDFTFKLNIAGQKGESYNWSVVNEKGAAVTPTQTGTVVGNDNGAAEITGITLQNGWKVKVDGLSTSDKYTITETETKGYTPDADLQGKEITFTATADKTETFNNEKNGSVPTGILMSAAPYAGLVALGGIFAGLFFRRKRED